MEKKLRIGNIGSSAVWVVIKIDEKENLSITGNVGTRSFGQIRDELLKITHCEPGWNVGKIVKLHSIWKEWHLNNLVAGSPAQEKWIEAAGVNRYNDILQEMPAHILDDETYLHNGKPYRYGSAWLCKDVPADVLEWLREL